MGKKAQNYLIKDNRQHWLQNPSDQNTKEYTNFNFKKQKKKHDYMKVNVNSHEDNSKNKNIQEICKYINESTFYINSRFCKKIFKKCYNEEDLLNTLCTNYISLKFVSSA